MKRSGLAGIHIWLQKLLLLQLLFNALIPAGYMPSQTDEESLTLVICTSEGLKTVSIDFFDQSDTGEEDNHKQNSYCTWMGRDNAALLTVLASANLVDANGVRVEPILVRQTLSIAAAHSYYSRAPPA